MTMAAAYIKVMGCFLQNSATTETLAEPQKAVRRGSQYDGEEQIDEIHRNARLAMTTARTLGVGA